jgi:hypothetical protein
MSNGFSNPAFQRNEHAGHFNLVSHVNSFNSIFDVKPLDPNESLKIENLLLENHASEEATHEEIKTDVKKLQSLTADIKAIGRQGTVLIGERVFQAMQILKPYKNGTFTKWLESTFGAKKTGYNCLAYFELYRGLPDDDLREKFKKIPLRSAYILASREGEPKVKEEIIREYHELGHHELITMIQKRLPLLHEDKRSYPKETGKLISQILENFLTLLDRKENLTENEKESILKLKELAEEILQ